MTLLDAREVPGGTSFEADVCVVGAGAAGITLATQLEQRGRSVLLVEAGGLTPDEDTQSLHDLVSDGYPVRENFMSRARYYGGTCNLWAGRSMLLGAFDLSPRAWVPGSGWPIPEQELSRHLAAAATLLGLPVLDFFRPESYRHALSERERALAWPDATEPLRPRISLWGKRPRRFGAAALGGLRRSPRIRLILHANATGLGLHANGERVRELTARTLAGGELKFRAQQFVLASGGLENARLLLVSRDVQPAGIGNAFDQVGRCFMDHPRAIHGRVTLRRPTDFALLRGVPLARGRAQWGIGLSEAIQEREGLLNHYATFETEVSEYTAQKYSSFIQMMKKLLRRGYAGRRFAASRKRLEAIPQLVYLLTPKELVPHFAYRIHHRLRRLSPRRPASERRIVVYFCEQPPDPTSRVVLDEQRDALGLPRLRLHWHLGDEITRSVRRLEELLRDHLRRTGAGELEPGPEEIRYSDASHHTGTTRMSALPRDGVVDPDGRVHGTRNLFACGSSVFPSAGHSNPTLTIVALALRLADHLATRS